MALSSPTDLRKDLIRQIDAWQGSFADFRHILNNAIDIDDEPQLLISRIATHIGERPGVIELWRQGVTCGPNTQQRVLRFLKAVLAA